MFSYCYFNMYFPKCGWAPFHVYHVDFPYSYFPLVFLMVISMFFLFYLLNFEKDKLKSPTTNVLWLIRLSIFKSFFIMHLYLSAKFFFVSYKIVTSLESHLLSLYNEPL